MILRGEKELGFRRRRIPSEACVLVVLLGLVLAYPQAAWAQDVYKLNYFANNTLLPPAPPDETVRTVNPTGTDRCADIYVFDASQNLQECCGCLITHNGLLTLSVRSQPPTTRSLGRCR